jgi:hypothetical protein
MVAEDSLASDGSGMNELQDAVLSAISGARDSIDNQFRLHADPKSLVDETLIRLSAYLSDRSQAASYLVSAGFVWDAEIVLRSFYEANARIWFICLAEPSKRGELVEEFWGGLASIHNSQRAKKAAAPLELSKNRNNPHDEAIFSMLTREDLFEFSQENRKIRKSLEQKWSFTEIVNQLQKSPAAGFDMRAIGGLLHSYGTASHLIHADESALDLMLDRALRQPEERQTLAKAHICRIFSDQVSLWTMSAAALGFRFGGKAIIQAELRTAWDRIHALTEPFLRRFYASQAEFYAKWGASQGESP